MKLVDLKILVYSIAVVCLLVIAGAAQTRSVQLPESATAKVLAAEPRPSDIIFARPSDLNRVGVQTAQPVSISLADAIRRALENNNDIEVSRDDVRLQRTRVTALEGIYDPVLTISPTYSSTSNTFQS